jgi:hypothetical protein
MYDFRMTTYDLVPSTHPAHFRVPMSKIANRKSKFVNSIYVAYGSRAMKRARLMARLAFLWQPAQLPLRLRE